MADLLTIQKPDTKEITQLALHEYIPADRFYSLINSGALDQLTIAATRNGLVWSDQKQGTLKYFRRMKDGFHRTYYVNSSTSKYGRVRPKDEMGAICMRRDIRNYLMADYYDIDMRNSHVSIMLSILAQQPDIKPDTYKNWRYYYDHREDVLEELRQYDPDRDWKQYMTSLLFYGHHDEAKDHPFLCKLVNELNEITRIIQNHNSKFWDYTRRKKGDNFHPGSFLSQYLMEHEYRIVENIISFLYYEYQSILRFKGNNVLSYEYDGFKVLKANVPDIDALLQTINERARVKYPLVEFVNKEMKDRIEVPEVEAVADLQRYEELAELRTDQDVVDILKEMIGNNIIFTGDKSWYYFNGERWRFFKDHPHELRADLHRIVLSFFKERVPESQQMLWEKIRERLPILNQHKIRNDVIGICKDTFYDKENRAAMFNRKDMLFGFDNGVYDLEADEFRPYRYDDYTTHSCGRNYEERDENKIKELMDVLRRIHPPANEFRMVMMIRASGLCGRQPENFIAFNGAGRNGKGFCDEMQQEAMGHDYCMTAEPSLLTKPIPDDGKSPAHAQMRGKRFVITKEPRPNEKFDNSTIKSLTGGGMIKARFLYDNNDHVRQTWTLVCELNERVPLKHRACHAEVARWIDIYFGSTFDEVVAEDDWENRIFVVDLNLKSIEYKDKYAMSFLHILIDHFRIWRQNNYRFELTDQVIQRTKEYLLDCDPVHQFFKAIYQHVGPYKGEFPRERRLPITTIYDSIFDTHEVTLLSKEERRLLSKANIIRYLQGRGIVVHNAHIDTRAYIVNYDRIDNTLTDPLAEEMED